MGLFSYGKYKTSGACSRTLRNNIHDVAIGDRYIFIQFHIIYSFGGEVYFIGGYSKTVIDPRRAQAMP